MEGGRGLGCNILTITIKCGVVMHTCMDVYMHMYMHACMHTCIQRNAGWWKMLLGATFLGVLRFLGGRVGLGGPAGVFGLFVKNSDLQDFLGGAPEKKSS